MCGILGIKLKGEFVPMQKILKLAEQLKIRGLHSCGVSFIEDGKVQTYKVSPIESITGIALVISQMKGKGMIWHNRYSTSGDWQDMQNNMPIQVEGVGAISLNGVISMATKEEYMKVHQVSCTTGNDAEILLQKMKQGISIKEFASQYPEASIACVVLRENGSILAYRNNKRPLYLYEDEDFTCVVSTLDTIRRAGLQWREAKIIPADTEVLLK